MSTRKPSPSAVTTAEIDPALAPIAAAFIDLPGVELGRKFGSRAVLSTNGKIFCLISRGNLVVKLPAPRVQELVERGQGVLFDPGHGRLMKEWLSVEPGTTDWLGLAREAHTWVSASAVLAPGTSRQKRKTVP